uniref:Uncharacterized protein n=1 Tax=Timema bartmani TaxID=61472 RepID=A0A7R9EVF8_9NEOP|nr:unnamed protein product [Timema bartmani]
MKQCFVQGDSSTASLIPPGSVVKVLAEFRALRPGELVANKGECVQIVAYNPQRGYLVLRQSDAEEGWLPAHVLSHQAVVARKPWSFRFRKPSFSGGGRRGSPFNPPSQPHVQVLNSKSILVQWEGEACGHFLLECSRHQFGDWVPVGSSTKVQGLSHVVDGLTPGETYSFRVLSPLYGGAKIAGLPSSPVATPLADASRFRHRYQELEELGLGRFAVVRKARDRGTSQEVAVKQVSCRRQCHSATHAEYSLMAQLHHVNVVRALALFDNAPQLGTDSIVIEL